MDSVELHSKLEKLQVHRAGLQREIVTTDASIATYITALKKAKAAEVQKELADKVAAAEAVVTADAVKKKAEKKATKKATKKRKLSVSSSSDSSSSSEEVEEEAAPEVVGAMGSSSGGATAPMKQKEPAETAEKEEAAAVEERSADGGEGGEVGEGDEGIGGAGTASAAELLVVTRQFFIDASCLSDLPPTSCRACWRKVHPDKATYVGPHTKKAGLCLQFDTVVQRGRPPKKAAV